MGSLATSLLIICATVLLYALEHSERASVSAHPAVRRALIGVVLGATVALALQFGTELSAGITLSAACVAFVCAGLFFGPLAALTSGLSCGVYLFCAYGGDEEAVVLFIFFTFTALLAAFIKSKVIRDEEPPFSIALALLLTQVATLMFFDLLLEVEHLVEAAFWINRASLSLILINVITLACIFYLIRAMRRRKGGMSLGQSLSLRRDASPQGVSATFQRRLSIIAYVAVILFTFITVLLVDTAALLEKKADFEDIIQSYEQVFIQEHDIQGLDEDDSRDFAILTADSLSTGFDEIAAGKAGTGYLIVDGQGTVLTEHNEYAEQIVSEQPDEPLRLYSISLERTDGTGSPIELYTMYKDYDSYRIVVYASKLYEDFVENLLYISICFFQFLFILVLLCVSSIHFRKTVSKDLSQIKGSLAALLTGSYEEIGNEARSREFDELSAMVNETVAQFKQNTEQKMRLANDFELARSIQMTSLPRTFPAFPEHSEFDLYAVYIPANQVGGDFYNYFFVDHQRLAILIADVSGKGIPAALFMMKAKMAIQAFARPGSSPSEILCNANNYLCADNDAGMFVTCWLGLLDTATGELQYASAGHDSPLLLRAEGRSRALPQAGGIMLGFVENTPYAGKSSTMRKNDLLFLYTDGVTEAKNEDDALFGKTRMTDICKKRYAQGGDAGALCAEVVEAVTRFRGNAEQFDDITMVALQYFGDFFSCEPAERAEWQADDAHAYSMVFSSSTANVTQCKEKLDELCGECGVPSKVVFQADMIVDEMVSNIVRHGELKSIDRIALRLEIGADSRIGSRKHVLRMTIADPGIAFNPLEHDNPNISPSLSDAEAGGVGIYLVKHTANELSYERIDGKNVLTVGLYYRPSTRAKGAFTRT